MTLVMQPGASDVILECWSIRETDKGHRHFVGWNVIDADGRVSTPIQWFEPETRTGVTASGSRYRLLGRAGQHKDAEYVWGIAARAWEVQSWTDVTAELVPDWRNPNPKAAVDFSRPNTAT